MQGLAGHKRKTVADELLVFGEGGALEDAVSAVGLVVEEWVADVLQMHANLVRAAGFQLAFDEGYISESFHHAPVRDGMFALVAALGEDGHHHAVFGVAPHVADNGAGILFHVAPDQRPVLAFQVVVEEGLRQPHLR